MLTAVLFLSGCTGLAAWWAVPGHQASVAAVAAIGGATYAVEKAGVGAFELGEKVTGAVHEAPKPQVR